jgi:hypothetical protein
MTIIPDRRTAMADCSGEDTEEEILLDNLPESPVGNGTEDLSLLFGCEHECLEIQERQPALTFSTLFEVSAAFSATWKQWNNSRKGLSRSHLKIEDSSRSTFEHAFSN